MSEYWSYDFLAVDRPLTKSEQRHLRQISTRAKITARSFFNEYYYGDLKANPSDLLAAYFDVYCHTGCFRWRTLGLRFPADIPGLELWKTFLPVLKNLHQEKLILLCDNGEDPESEYAEMPEESPQDLAPLRNEVLSGDSRPLYLAWLRRLQSFPLAEDHLEPPVPPGLSELTEAQECMVRFLEIDEHLLAAAAEASPPLDPEITPFDPTGAIAALSASKKDAILGLLADAQPEAALAQLRVLLLPSSPSPSKVSGKRCVADLKARSEVLAAAAQAEYQRQVAERKALRKAQEAQRRGTHLDSLEGREDQIWRKVRELISQTNAHAYDQAVVHLVDLRDLARRGETEKSFQRRLGNLRKKFSRRPSFLRRLNTALPPADSDS